MSVSIASDGPCRPLRVRPRSHVGNARRGEKEEGEGSRFSGLCRLRAQLPVTRPTPTANRTVTGEGREEKKKGGERKKRRETVPCLFDDRTWFRSVHHRRAPEFLERKWETWKREKEKKKGETTSTRFLHSSFRVARPGGRLAEEARTG